MDFFYLNNHQPSWKMVQTSFLFEGPPLGHVWRENFTSQDTVSAIQNLTSADFKWTLTSAIKKLWWLPSHHGYKVAKYETTCTSSFLRNCTHKMFTHGYLSFKVVKLWDTECMIIFMILPMLTPKRLSTQFKKERDLEVPTLCQ